MACQVQDKTINDVLELLVAEVFDGQRVGPNHLVIDGDVVELHL